MSQARRLRRVADPPVETAADRRDGFDVRALLNARGDEAFALHARYMNPQMPRILRTLGFDRDMWRARCVPLRR
jgi:hypothetical protein